MSEELQLNFRNATAADWPQIEPMLQKTWEWGDYIDQDVWLSWVNSVGTRQHLVVAELNEAPVAFARLSELSDGEWWLEGMRVAPDHQGKGIGRALLDHVLSIYRREGVGFVRFVTSSTNEKMHALARDQQFRHTGKYTLMESAPELFDYRPFKILQSQNAGLVQQYLRSSPMHRVNKFVEQDWTLYFLTSERLSAYLSDPRVQVIGWRQRDSLLGIAILFLDTAEADANLLHVGYLDAADDTTLRAMLHAVRGLALKREHDRVVWKMPLGVGLEKASEDCGMSSQWESELWLFEYQRR